MRFIRLKEVTTAAFACLALCFAAGCATQRTAQITHEEERPPLTVKAVFGSNMVLQRGVPLVFNGTAEPERPVIVRVGESGSAAITGPDGNWAVTLEALPAMGPVDVLVSDVRSLITFTNVMVGDVFICSGQSNMEWPLKRAMNAVEEIAAADLPGIRYRRVARRMSTEPLADISSADWQVVSPDTAGDMSGVAFFFARELHAEKDVAIGIVDATWGGTPAEAWTSRKALAAAPGLQHMVEEFDMALRSYPRDLRRYERREERIQREYQRAFEAWYERQDLLDPGMTDGWSAVDFDDNTWREIDLPQIWRGTRHGRARTIKWVRRAIDLPNDMTGQDLLLSMGGIDDEDITYFNGHVIGRTGRETENHWKMPRIYRVSADIVQSGRNVIAVRVYDFGTTGGFVGQPEQLRLSVADNDELSIPLAGEWRSKVGVYSDPAAHPRKEIRPRDPAAYSRSPALLFNGMINPLAGLPVCGVLWYQGESNVGRAAEYRRLFPALINDWRSHWDDSALPFIWVQLANYRHPVEQPGESDWAELREAQAMALALTNTAMAVAIDIGEAEVIHPGNKQDVGRRLALAARHVVYGENIVYSGPVYQNHEVREGEIVVAFRHVADGLVARDGTLRGFAVAGEDGVFVNANARIDGERVIAGSPDVPRPVHLRYAWADNPAGCNLYNSAGLPAVPFRTDRPDAE